jgi:hypothetical protein
MCCLSAPAERYALMHPEDLEIRHLDPPPAGPRRSRQGKRA